MAADPTDVSDDRSDDRAPEAVAVQELYERHAARVYSFCLHQLGNREEAEDATQSTFLNAFRGLRRGVAPVAETAWLLAIARNVCLTRVRSTVRRRRLEAPRDLHTLQDTVPARVAAGGDELLWLEDALSGLPANQRRAILLREWQGLSYDEIAADLGTTHGAVETLIFRGRRTLAQRLEVTPRRRRVAQRVGRWVDLGAGAGWLKALLAGGTAKAVATASVVATVAVAGSAPLRHDEPPAAASAAPPSGPQASATAPPAAWSVLSAKRSEAQAPVRVAAKRVAAVRRLTPTPPPSRGRSGMPPPPGASDSGTPAVVEASERRGKSQPSERARQRPVSPRPEQPDPKPEEEEQQQEEQQQEQVSPPTEQPEGNAERAADDENRERQKAEKRRDDNDREREDEQQETDDEEEEEDELPDDDAEDEQDPDEENNEEEDDDRRRAQP